jgi:hypothetical protein
MRLIKVSIIYSFIPFFFLQLKMLSMLGQDVDSRFPVTEMECADKISELKEGMTKAFEYSLGRPSVRLLLLLVHNAHSFLAPKIPRQNIFRVDNVHILLEESRLRKCKQ